MQQFVDEVVVTLSSGHGGAGRVSFRREKYVPKGGPDGGDGGRGGDVLVRVRQDLRTLLHLTRNRHVRAEDGQPGGQQVKNGRDGHDAILEVPPGTVLYDRETGELILDTVSASGDVTLLTGGRGGKGNKHFATSRNQTPRFAQDGEPGAQLTVLVEMRLIADVGLVGKPNAGKSSLLGRLTAAHPKIGNYAFTTKIPNLGTMQIDDESVIIADIPGLIEGASTGAGLGDKFLRHISRTATLAVVVDLSEGDVPETINVLEDELAAYSEELARLPRVIVGNKIDLPESRKGLELVKERCPDDTIIAVSAITGDNVRELAGLFLRLATSPGGTDA